VNKKALSKVDWKAILNNKSVEKMWTIFKEIILQQSKLHVPVKKDYKPTRKDWISKSTIKQMKLRSAALKNVTCFRLAATVIIPSN